MKFYILLLLLAISSPTFAAKQQDDLLLESFLRRNFLLLDDPNGNDAHSLAEVVKFENQFKALAKAEGIAVATKNYLADGFTAERHGGDVLDAFRYTDFLRSQNLDVYFANPQQAHFATNHELHVTHTEQASHEVYKFHLVVDKHVNGGYKLKNITLNDVHDNDNHRHRHNLRLAGPVGSKDATEQLEAAIIEIAAPRLLNAQKYFTDDFRFVVGPGKSLESAPFLTSIVGEVGAAKYFHAPLATQFDANRTLIFVLEENHQKYEFRAVQAPHLKGRYQIRSGGKLVSKRRHSKNHWRSSSSSTSSNADYVEI